MFSTYEDETRIHVVRIRRTYFKQVKRETEVRLVTKGFYFPTLLFSF